MKLSARNILQGKVRKLVPGAVNTEVIIELAGGQQVAAIITQGIGPGAQAEEGQNRLRHHQGQPGHRGGRRVMRPTMVCRVACALLAGLLLSGCEQPTQAPPQVSVAPAEAAPSKVTVAAAANLKFAFDSIVAKFEKEHADIDVEVTYGSSGNFFAQLSQQAPFDIFLSADTAYPTKLVEQGLAPQDAYFVYGIGRLVVWVPTSSPLEIEELGLAALVEPSVQKIAIANPQLAPYGKAAEAALQRAGMYDAVKDRLVRGDNISQTAQFVESGAADAGLLALSLALAPKLKGQGRYFEVPAEAHEPIEQAGVVLSRAKNAEAANQLRSFLTGSDGQKLLAEFGYRAPGK